MLGPLDEIVDSDEFREAGFAYAVSIRHVEYTTTVELRVDEGDGPPHEPNWRVTCSDRWKFWVEDDVHDIFVYEVEDPTALQFTDEQKSLFFSAPPNDVDVVLVELWEAHSSVSGREIPFARYFNGEIPIRSLLTGYGQLGTGPAFLLDAYARVLRKHGMHPSLLSNGHLARWENGQHRNAPALLRLACLGGAVLLAASFESERIGRAAG